MLKSYWSISYWLISYWSISYWSIFYGSISYWLILYWSLVIRLTYHRNFKIQSLRGIESYCVTIAECCKSCCSLIQEFKNLRRTPINRSKIWHGFPSSHSNFPKRKFGNIKIFGSGTLCVSQISAIA